MAELNCIHGNHGLKRTWCRHDSIRGEQPSRSVANHRCEVCPLYEAFNGQPRPPRQTATTAARPDCQHLLPIVRDVECKVCSGGLKTFPVHGCGKHKECATTQYSWEKLRENQQRVKSCQTCKDYQAWSLEQLAIIAVHFNPMGYQLPVRNYHRWREELGTLNQQLVLAELSFNGNWDTDANIRIQGDPERHLMFQKEALINLVVRQLPEAIRYVAWVDHDLLFYNKSWATTGLEMLHQGYGAVQLFDTVRFRDIDGAWISDNPGAAWHWLQFGRNAGSPGGAWMVRRDYFEAMGGLDPYMITGGGDVSGFDAWSGYHSAYYYKCISAEMAATQQAWVQQARAKLPGRLGYVPGSVDHLFHGTRENRQYTTRTKMLQSFSPARDVRINSDGILEWTGHNPRLQRQIAQYFAARQEDTAPQMLATK